MNFLRVRVRIRIPQKAYMYADDLRTSFKALSFVSPPYHHTTSQQDEYDENEKKGIHNLFCHFALAFTTTTTTSSRTQKQIKKEPRPPPPPQLEPFLHLEEITCGAYAYKSAFIALLYYCRLISFLFSRLEIPARFNFRLSCDHVEFST